MDRMLSAATPKSIIHAIENSRFDLYIQATHHHLPQKIHVEPDIKWIKTEPTGWPNYIFGAEFNQDNVNERIDYMIEQIKSANAPPFWLVGPATKPPELRDLFHKSGFQELRVQTGMAIELSEYQSNIKIIPDIAIKVVDSEEGLIQWSRIVSRGFGYLKQDLEIVKNLFRQNSTRFYTAFYCDEPIATALVLFSSGVASLHLVTTLPDYRNKGIGKAITGVALSDSYQMGYQFCVLQASQLGEPIYQKMGFKEYCKIHTYEYQGA